MVKGFKKALQFAYPEVQITWVVSHVRRVDSCIK